MLAGAGGVIDHASNHELKRQGWRLRALVRGLLNGAEPICAGLTDADATAHCQGNSDIELAVQPWQSRSTRPKHDLRRGPQECDRSDGEIFD
jgi:hypothetical protein